MRALRIVCMVLLVLASGHGALHGFVHVGIGGIGLIMAEAMTPDHDPDAGTAKQRDDEERREKLHTAKGDLAVHLVKGLAIGLVAMLAFAAVIVVGLGRRSVFAAVVGAAVILSAAERAGEIPGDRARAIEKGEAPGAWYQVQPSFTFRDYLPSGLAALGGALAIAVFFSTRKDGAKTERQGAR